MNVIKSYLRNLWGTYLHYKYKRLYEKEPSLAADSLYYKIYKRHLNLNEPKNLIEKITWLLLNTDTSLWSLCADKFRMRSYVEEKGFGEYLPKLYGHWDNPEDMNFNDLPNQFVLKANNGCATVMIVRDKSTLNIEKTKRTLKKWLERPYGYMGAQKHYLAISPCIIAEELLHQDDAEKMFSPKSMVDYKIWCFKGKPENVLVVYNRDSEGYYLDLYDLDWCKIENNLKMNGHFGYRKACINKPVCLEEMKQIASALSEPFDEVRVDFYVVNGKPVVGEMTFTTGYGYFTDDYYNYLGDKIHLD